MGKPNVKPDPSMVPLERLAVLIVARKLRVDTVMFVIVVQRGVLTFICASGVYRTDDESFSTICSRIVRPLCLSVDVLKSISRTSLPEAKGSCIKKS